ncbi:MAG: hypothetical protein PF569_10115 [Candidatus Woesearchaeota archaeon]|jgi:hypothetical protein|nr:hypothetical protein [Candidatus Woesearchaeota archaeon]
MTSLLENKLGDFSVEFVESLNYSSVFNRAVEFVSNNYIHKFLIDSYESSSTDFLFRSYLQNKSIKTLKLWQKQSLVLAFMGFGIEDENSQGGFLSLATDPLAILASSLNCPLLYRKAIFIEDEALSKYDCENWEGIANSHFNIAQIIEDYLDLDKKNLSVRSQRSWLRRNTSEYCQAGDIFMLDHDEFSNDVSMEMAFKSYLYGTMNFLKMYYLYDDRAFFELAKYPKGKLDEIIETNYLIEDELVMDNYFKCEDYFQRIRRKLGFSIS